MDNYAIELIRGIPNYDCIDNEGRASALLFQFDNNDRPDGYLEVSINWYDDDNALNAIFNQKKRNDANTYQFKIGAAIISRIRLDSLIRSPNAKDALSYERNIIDDNPYHGNILLKPNLAKNIKTMLSGSIAMCVESIKYRQE
jgi:hypothetical protein